MYLLPYVTWVALSMDGKLSESPRGRILVLRMPVRTLWMCHARHMSLVGLPLTSITLLLLVQVHRISSLYIGHCDLPHTSILHIWYTFSICKSLLYSNRLRGEQGGDSIDWSSSESITDHLDSKTQKAHSSNTLIIWYSSHSRHINHLERLKQCRAWTKESIMEKWSYSHSPTTTFFEGSQRYLDHSNSTTRCRMYSSVLRSWRSILK